MRQSEIYARVLKQWVRDNPGGEWIVSDSDRPDWFYRGYPTYVSFTELKRELHVGYANLLRILASEKVAVIRVARGMGHSCYILREELPGLMAAYANEPAASEGGIVGRALGSPRSSHARIATTTAANGATTSPPPATRKSSAATAAAAIPYRSTPSACHR